MKREKAFFRIELQDWLIAGFVFLFSLFLYVRTLVPTVLTADAAEFQTLSYTMGMTHPSGYSTYIFLGRIFTLIPVENIAYRVNLMSAFFGALAVGQVYLIIRLLNGHRLAAFAGASALAIHPLFWQRTIFAETYAPASGMITSIWLLMLLWRESKNAHYLFVAGLLGGLSVGIHSTVIMTAFSVFVYMLFQARRRKDWFYAGAGAFLGVFLTFLAFMYLDFNNPPSSIYNTKYLPNLTAHGITIEEFDTPIERLLEIFPARSFWTYYFSADGDEIRFRLREFLTFYPWWEISLMLIGFIFLPFARKGKKALFPEALYALIAFLLIWGFAVTVIFSVYKEFYVMVSVFVHVWLGVGVSFLLAQTGKLLSKLRRLSPQVPKTLTNLMGLGVIVAVFIHARVDLNLAVQSGYTTFIRDEGIYSVSRPDRYMRIANRLLNKVEDDAIVFAVWDRLYMYVYAAHVEQGRTSILFHEAWPHLEEDTLAYIAEIIKERPVYFASYHPEISEYYDLEEVGDGKYRLREKK